MTLRHISGYRYTRYGKLTHRQIRILNLNIHTVKGQHKTQNISQCYTWKHIGMIAGKHKTRGIYFLYAELYHLQSYGNVLETQAKGTQIYLEFCPKEWTIRMILGKHLPWAFICWYISEDWIHFVKDNALLCLNYFDCMCVYMCLLVLAKARREYEILWARVTEGCESWEPNSGPQEQ